MKVIEFSLFDSLPEKDFNSGLALFLQFGSFDNWLHMTDFGIDVLYKYFYFL